MTPIRAVIFDFHATLVDQGDADEWLDRALARVGAGCALDDRDREAVTLRLDDIWAHAREIDPGSGRDLSEQNHRDVFHGVMDGHVEDDLRHALYDVMLELWRAYDEAPDVLAELRRRGMGTAIVSNVGVDIRPVMAREGLVADVVVLSCEVGAVKPDARIFQAALEALDVPATAALMVGDNWADDAAASALGVRSLILPRTRGRRHGLDIVLRLAD